MTPSMTQKEIARELAPLVKRIEKLEAELERCRARRAPIDGWRVMPEEPRWDDEMHEASTLGLPCPRPPSYGREVIAYQKELERQRNVAKRKKEK